MKVLIWAVDARLSLRRLCGIPLIRRLLYTLRAVDLREVILVSDPDGLVEKEIGNGANLGVCITYCQPCQISEYLAGPFLAVEGNYVLDERIFRHLVECEGMIMAYDSQKVFGLSSGGKGGYSQGKMDRVLQFSPVDGAYVGVSRCFPEVLKYLQGSDWSACLSKSAEILDFKYLDIASIPTYHAEIRRELPIFWSRIDTNHDAELCKRELIARSQKKTLDILAWYINRPVENWIMYYISDLPITPNWMSLLTYLVAFLVTFLLLNGWILPASILTFCVNIMDGLDGKLARVKGMMTKLGHLEHSFDLLYEQSWYIALAWAVHKASGGWLPLVMGFAILLFDSFSRHVSMQFHQVTGRALADYAPFDRKFRKFDGRRNIYTIYILAGALSGMPFFTLAVIALHALVTGIVYIVRAAMHLHRADWGYSA